MYDELIKNLRICSRCDFGQDCNGCTQKSDDAFCCDKLLHQAADAIEELQQIAGHYEEAAKDYFKDVCYYLERIPKWIPVTERLPEDNEAVNVVWVNHRPVIYYQHIKDKPQTATGVYYRGKWYWWSAVVQDYLAEYGKCEPDLMDDAIEVTHWMPLPQPPKDGEA